MYLGHRLTWRAIEYRRREAAELACRSAGIALRLPADALRHPRALTRVADSVAGVGDFFRGSVRAHGFQSAGWRMVDFIFSYLMENEE